MIGRRSRVGKAGHEAKSIDGDCRFMRRGERRRDRDGVAVKLIEGPYPKRSAAAEKAVQSLLSAGAIGWGD